MVETIHSQWEEIVPTLKFTGCSYLTESIDLRVLGALVCFLKPFKEASDALEESNHTTLFLALLWDYKLLDILKPSDANRSLEHALKTEAKGLLEAKFQITSFHMVTVFLHPNYKGMKMISEKSGKEQLLL